MSNRMPPLCANEPNRARSVRRPSTGVRSSLKSPECNTTPCAVCNAMACACGTECVTGMNSTSNGPMRRISPSRTTLSEVFPKSPASSMRLRASPSVTADPYNGNDISRNKNCNPPTWSSCPCVATHPTMRSAFSRSQVKSGNTRSMPCISGSGNMRPQSMSKISLSCSTAMQLRPISPNPPRK